MQRCEQSNGNNKDKKNNNYSLAAVFGQQTKNDVEVLIQTLGFSVASFMVMTGVAQVGVRPFGLYFIL